MQTTKHRNRLQHLWLCLACALLLSHCAFGDTANATEEENSLNAFLLTVIGVEGTGVLQLRFGDGGTDGINQFSTTAGTVVLGDAVWLDIEKIDVYAGQSNGFPLARASYYIDRIFWALSPIAPLAAHEEEVTPAAGVRLTETGRDIFVTPLASGNTGNATDSLGRTIYALPEIRVALPPGRIQRIVVHVRRMQFNGTIGGNPYSVLYSVNSDFAVSPACNADLASKGTSTLPLYFNYAQLFRNVGAANTTAVNSAFATNIPRGGILSESECFSL